MNVEVRDFEHKYSFELRPITQLCGQNIRSKTFILESFKRYYGGFRYPEEKNRWRDNVFIDGSNTGRKYYSIISVSTRENLIAAIKLSKQSMMLEHLKHMLTEFGYQDAMMRIEDELDKIFMGLNESLHRLGGIELNFEPSELWDIVQQSDIIDSDGNKLEEKTSAELICIFLNLLDEIIKENPKKTIVICENIDHLLSRDEYKKTVNHMRRLTVKYDLYFMLSTSLYGYPLIDSELIEGITVFNDVEFTLPELIHVSDYISENYPIAHNFEEDDLLWLLSGIVHNIGGKGMITGTTGVIINKLINKSLGIDEKVDISASSLEMSFANS